MPEMQKAIITINHQLVDFNDRVYSRKENLANITPKARCTQRWPALGAGCRQAWIANSVEEMDFI